MNHPLVHSREPISGSRKRREALLGLYKRLPCPAPAISLAPHCIASPLDLMAAVHRCATAPNFVALEFHAEDVPFWNSLVSGPAVIQNGCVAMTDQPRWGLELNEAVAREYARPGEP